VRNPSLLFFSIGAALAAGCGPSFQATYECDVHFEHCYALDETPAAVGVKRRCWSDWLAGYTFGQPRDRVDFAASRVKALAAPRGPVADVPPAASATRTVAAPLPTTAFAPPPSVASATVTGGPPDSAAPDPQSMRPPAAECTASCEERWTSCRDGCRDAACTRCDRAYRSCVSTCVR